MPTMSTAVARSLGRVEKAFLVVFLALIFFHSFQAIGDADSFYHVKAGELIWQTKAIPRADVFSASAAGAPWIAHEWLAELLFYGTFAAFGPWGLVALAALLAACAYALLFAIAFRRGANFYITLFVLFLAAATGFHFWVPRPQSIVFFLTALLLFFLEEYRRSPRRGWLYGMAALILLWANVNASVALGILVMALFLAAMFAERRAASPATRDLGAALLVSAVAAFMNPNGYRIFTYGLTVLPAVRAFAIYEWQPITAFWEGIDTKFFIALIVVSGLFLLVEFGRRKNGRDLAWCGLVLGASVAPFVAARYFAFWPILVGAPLSVALSRRTERLLVGRPPNLLPGAALTSVVLSLIFIPAPLPTSPVDKAALPVRAADFLLANGAMGNAFNTYNEGGYLLSRLYPQIKIFMDGRSEVFEGRPTQEYFAILRDASSTHALIDEKYHIEYFILPYDTDLFSRARPLLVDLKRAGWELVSWDDGAIVVARNDPANKALIAAHALHYISPFLDPARIAPQDVAGAERELSALLAAAPDSPLLQSYARDFLRSHVGTALSPLQ